MASLTLDLPRRVVALRNEGEHLIVEIRHKAQHEPGLSLIGVVIVMELNPFERNAVSANVAVLASHAQGKRKVTHDPKETIVRDVGRKDPQVLELVRNLRGDRYGGYREEQRRAGAYANGEPPGTDLVCCQKSGYHRAPVVGELQDDTVGVKY